MEGRQRGREKEGERGRKERGEGRGEEGKEGERGREERGRGREWWGLNKGTVGLLWPETKMACIWFDKTVVNSK